MMWLILRWIFTKERKAGLVGSELGNGLDRNLYYPFIYVCNSHCTYIPVYPMQPNLTNNPR